MADEELEREVAALRESYRRRLPAKLDRLAAALREARRGRSEEGPLRASRDLAHMLKGTSGSYGLDAISAELERIEAKLDRLLEVAPQEETETWSEIEAALARAQADVVRSS